MIPFLKLIYLPRQAASISGSFPEENEYFLSVCFEQTRMQWGKKKKGKIIAVFLLIWVWEMMMHNGGRGKEIRWQQLYYFSTVTFCWVELNALEGAHSASKDTAQQWSLSREDFLCWINHFFWKANWGKKRFPLLFILAFVSAVTDCITFHSRCPLSIAVQERHCDQLTLQKVFCLDEG